MLAREMVWANVIIHEVLLGSIPKKKTKSLVIIAVVILNKTLI